MPAVTDSPRARSISATATRAPSRAKSCAPARPIPEPAPVTIATCPASRAIAHLLTDIARLVRQELPVRAVVRLIFPHLRLVDADAETLACGNAPCRAVGDRQRLREDVVLHHRCRLLVTVDDVRQREQHVLVRGGRDAELAVRVLADLQALGVRGVREPREMRERTDPSRAEAEHV